MYLVPNITSSAAYSLKLSKKEREKPGSLPDFEILLPIFHSLVIGYLESFPKEKIKEKSGKSGK